MFRKPLGSCTLLSYRPSDTALKTLKREALKPRHDHRASHSCTKTARHPTIGDSGRTACAQICLKGLQSGRIDPNASAFNTIIPRFIMMRLLGAILLLFTAVCTAADEFPLSRFPLFTQATSLVGSCVSSVSSVFSTSLGCPKQNPAACLCTDALKSSSIAYRIRTCGMLFLSENERTTATNLWASYCLTNAGVSAHDESLMQDIPYFTQVTNWVAVCATSHTSQFISSFGCNDYTKAPCLCGTASSERLLSAMTRCASVASGIDAAESLFRAYCDLNRKSPATRSIGAPIAVSGMFGSNWFSLALYPVHWTTLLTLLRPSDHDRRRYREHLQGYRYYPEGDNNTSIFCQNYRDAIG